MWPILPETRVASLAICCPALQVLRIRLCSQRAPFLRSSPRGLHCRQTLVSDRQWRERIAGERRRCISEVVTMRHLCVDSDACGHRHVRVDRCLLADSLLYRCHSQRKHLSARHCQSVRVRSGANNRHGVLEDALAARPSRALQRGQLQTAEQQNESAREPASERLQRDCGWRRRSENADTARRFEVQRNAAISVTRLLAGQLARHYTRRNNARTRGRPQASLLSVHRAHNQHGTIFRTRTQLAHVALL